MSQPSPREDRHFEVNRVLRDVLLKYLDYFDIGTLMCLVKGGGC